MSIDPNELERMTSKDDVLIKAVCRYSTGIKNDLPLGRAQACEFHQIKDWFALIPNDEAKAFAVWVLGLAANDFDNQLEKDY